MADQDAPLVYLQRCQDELPESASRFQECAELYSRRLWHQLTVTIEAIIEEVPQVTQKDFLIRFYDGFVANFGHRLNLLKLAKIAVRAARQYDQPTQAGDTIVARMAVMTLKSERAVSPSTAGHDILHSIFQSCL